MRKIGEGVREATGERVSTDVPRKNGVSAGKAWEARKVIIHAGCSPYESVARVVR